MRFSSVSVCLSTLFFATNGIPYRHVFIEPFSGGKTIEDGYESVLDYQSRIVNGQEVPQSSVPYQAYLVFNGTYVVGNVSYENTLWLCGGSLISQRFVLTAAHCVDGAHTVLVYLGGHNLAVNETSRLKIESHTVIIHEKYNKDRIQFDVGLIQLPENVNFTDSIYPVRLPPRIYAKSQFSGFRAIVSGFGRVDGFATASVTLLQYNEVNIVSNDRCTEYFSNVIPEVICTSGTEFRGICSGDSGGPLVWNGYLVGVVSYSVVYCLPGYPGGFARVTQFLDWIQEHSDVVIA